MAIEVKQARDPSAVDRILRSLPDWFGIEDAIVGYVGDAAELPSYLAVVDGEVVGIALVRRHFPQSAELHLIAVAPTHHNHGVGRTLVRAIEGDLTSSGGQLLAVHTVGPSYENAAYARTRGFYQRLGFVPLQEFDRIDWDGPTLVLVKSL